MHVSCCGNHFPTQQISALISGHKGSAEKRQAVAINIVNCFLLL